MHESGAPNPYRFKDGKKKSIIDEFIAKYESNPNSRWHVTKKVRKLSIDEQLEIFGKNLFSLFNFAYKKDMRVTMCRTKQKCEPYDFTELNIEVPNEYTNVINTLDDGTEDDDPLVEILFTLEKINKLAFQPTLDECYQPLTRCGCCEVWVSFDTFRWASVGLECEAGERAKINYDKKGIDNVVEDNMVLDVDVCLALEKILKDFVETVKKDPKWYSWFILQGIDIDEVFLWKLSE